MNTLELLDKKDLLKKRAQELISGAEKESRKLNETEDSEFENITKKLAEIDNEIRKIEEDNEKNLTKVTKKNKSMKKNFSLLRAINDVANNRSLDEIA